MSLFQTTSLVDRLGHLGLPCEQVPTDRLNSATSALLCFPMYMVANVHAWTSERQFHLPVLDLPGIEALAESLEIGRQEGLMPTEIEPGHRRTLGLLLKGAKAPDRIIYEYALETIRLFLDQATAPVGDAARAAVARSIVRVAEASSRGFFHTQTVTQAERECIGHIASALRLDQSEQAVKDLKQLEPPPVT